MNSLIANKALSSYKESLLSVIDYYIDSGILDNFLKEFDKNTIYRAVNSIYYDGECICVPQDGTYSMVLRYLQFGGRGLNALCLLSKAAGGIYE